ncbi:MAG: M14 family metallopeptidase [Candidatus Bathyarchaeota archaeon]|nr:M14 family metallopeptidase [Candidatus Bathyarchaeota archaeon]
MTIKLISPEKFFGYQLGSDRKIARWDKIVEYFKKVEKQSDKIKVIDMGPTTMGNPFLLVIISSPSNLKNLEHLRQVNAKISDPRDLSEKEVRGLIAEGKAVVCQSMSLHATEIAGTQMTPELAHDLLTRDDEETRRILENVIFLMIPCFNPDGEIMVADFYDNYLGTEYEGCNLPWLYNKYVGHDNNRDAFMTNMVESQYAAKIMYRDWHPQAYQDHHHMGSYGARLYVAPYSEPIHPHADPLIWRELSWYGAHMAYRLEEAEKTGILNAAQFLSWGHLGFHWLGNYHNIASMLTENASAKLATPMYIHPNQLTGDGSGPIRGFPHYKPQANFPHPWPGGWWRLRDIVEQVKIAAWGLLDMAARNKDVVLWNAYLKAKRQTERGKEGIPKAYVISSCHHDPLTAEKLIDKLLVQGIEIMRAKADFIIEGFAYPAGSYVVLLNQPKMGVIKTLLGRTIYPDDSWTREADGTPSRPQDMATDTLAEFMGVCADPLNNCPEVELEKVTEHKTPAGKVVGNSKLGYIFDSRLNDSFKATNTLIDKGLKITRVEECVEVGGKVFAPGSFIAPTGSEKNLNEIAKETGVDFYSLKKKVEGTKEVKPPRVALYQRYWGGNIDEGWTRWLLEQFKFPYTTVMDKEIKEGNLKEKFDVLLLPSDDTPLITGEKLDEYFTKHRFHGYMPNFPPEYRSGIGAEGVEAIKKFVESGGTLVAMNATCDFAIEKLGLRVKNVLKDVKPKDFFCPGSTLRVKVSNCHPLAYGMPENALSVFWNSPAFDVLPSDFNENYEIVTQYPEREIMQSGWLVGEEKIANKAAVVVAKHGKGKVVLMGCRSQHRGQTHGTFKLLFNNLL